MKMKQKRRVEDENNGRIKKLTESERRRKERKKERKMEGVRKEVGGKEGEEKQCMFVTAIFKPCR